MHSFQAHRRALTYASSLLLQKELRNGVFPRGQYLRRQRAPSVQQNHHPRRTFLLPAKNTPVSQASSSNSVSSSAVVYAVLSISGLVLLYLTASTNPSQLDFWRSERDEGDKKGMPFKRYKPDDALTRRQVDAILNWNTRSDTWHTVDQILRLDCAVICSNADGGEDRTRFGVGVRNGKLHWLMPGVFDGHAGSRTVSAVKEHLTDYVARRAGLIFNGNDPNAFDKAIKEAFIELDNDIMREADLALKSADPSAIPALEAAFAGSCALLSFYNCRQKMLKTACTGDSRAVLGRYSKVTGTWEAIPLSTDQTGRNESEIRRLQQEHPNEPDMIKDGRLLGLAVTRAFGDSRWKWPRELQELARDKFLGPSLRPGLLTPPYLTAEPEITTIDIQPENGDFLIQATDGLWDEMTSEQAVALVGKWLERVDPSKGPAPFVSNEEKRALAGVAADPETDFSNARQVAYGERVTEEDWVVKDENAASHLARNALGGRNESRLRGILSAKPPYSRDLRDDITINVLFFRKDPDGSIINSR